jgi:hypothetical protein
VIGPRCNRRVTCDPFPTNARSESAIAVNPLNPLNIVGASKRFTNPSIYAFSLAAYATFDGAQTWAESTLTLLSGWAGTSDPAVAWDNIGNAYLVALPFGPSSNPNDYTGPIIGIAVYKSTDGGRTWSPPNLIHSSSGDDKQWAAGDGNLLVPILVMSMRYGTTEATCVLLVLSIMALHGRVQDRILWAQYLLMILSHLSYQ